MFRLAGESTWNTKRTTHISNNGSSIFGGVAFCLGLGGGNRSGSGVLFGGHRNGFCWRHNTSILGRIANQNASNQNGVASFSAQLANHAIPRTWNFNQRLVCFHLRHGLVFLHGITNLHAPFNKFSFVNALTKIRKNEMTFVVRLFYASHVKFSKSE